MTRAQWGRTFIRIQVTKFVRSIAGNLRFQLEAFDESFDFLRTSWAYYYWWSINQFTVGAVVKFVPPWHPSLGLERRCRRDKSDHIIIERERARKESMVQIGGYSDLSMSQICTLPSCPELHANESGASPFWSLDDELHIVQIAPGLFSPD